MIQSDTRIPTGHCNSTSIHLDNHPLRLKSVSHILTMVHASKISTQAVGRCWKTLGGTFPTVLWYVGASFDLQIWICLDSTAEVQLSDPPGDPWIPLASSNSYRSETWRWEPHVNHMWTTCGARIRSWEHNSKGWCSSKSPKYGSAMFTSKSFSVPSSLVVLMVIAGQWCLILMAKTDAPQNISENPNMSPWHRLRQTVGLPRPSMTWSAKGNAMVSTYVIQWWTIIG